MSYNRPPIFTIQNLVEMAKLRIIEEKKDALIMICGARGNGKSTLNWKTSHRFGEFKVKRFDTIYTAGNFNPKKDMIYTRTDVLDFIRHRTYSICMVDEMINVGYNREFTREDQQAIIKALNQYRSHFNIIIMNNPFFYDLDPDFRNLIWMRIDITEKGIGIVHTANTSIYTNDVWDTKMNQKIEERWRGKLNKAPEYYKLTTFRGYLYFNDLSQNQQILYENLRDEKRAKANEYLFINTNLRDDKDANFYDKLIKLGERKELTNKQFENACYLNGEDMKEVKRKINYRLKKMGMEKKFEDLITREKAKIIIKDDLGFIREQKEEAI